jgi:membrane-associated protease RseP (regulator of RpoE activity)
VTCRYHIITIGSCLLVGLSQPAMAQTHSATTEHAALGIFLSPTPGDARVIDVVTGSPADQAGIWPGDRIKKFNQSPVLDYQDVIRLIDAGKPGDQVELFIERGRLQGTLAAVLGVKQQIFDPRQIARRTYSIVPGQIVPGPGASGEGSRYVTGYRGLSESNDPSTQRTYGRRVREYSSGPSEGIPGSYDVGDQGSYGTGSYGDGGVSGDR